MHNHKYFVTKLDFEQWIKNHRNIYIVDRVEVEKGLYIEYIQEPKHKQRRKRIWE